MRIIHAHANLLKWSNGLNVPLNQTMTNAITPQLDSLVL